MGSGSSTGKQSFIGVIFCQQDTTDGDREASAEVEFSRKSALNDMRKHLDTFIKQCAESTELPKYEAWIADLHPENKAVGEDGKISIDPRLFLADSDHRIMWNAHPGVQDAQQVRASKGAIVEEFTSTDKLPHFSPLEAT